ncbi:HipA family kinase [Devosia sp. FJ2-5-3]|uniref:HipA family kinase n=1 Tax=Devosia sp. FJ2-5-3 TaxID=2976680 RepID=UPI0023D7DA9E|nr:HipA family kinase [Devosia sp. FJ2-5-3]WEJ57877.1 hypothetical protein N0P34_17005 [Devosia sp. FJ2-5-3]
MIETYPTSTLVSKVKTDAGIGYLKGIGNPAGTGTLACELVGSELAALIGLTIPPFAIVNVEDIEIPLKLGSFVGLGPAFVSKEVRAEPATVGDSFVSRLAKPQDPALLVAFDTWIRNFDRCPPNDYLDPTPKRDNLLFAPVGRKFDMIVLDHSHCFTEGDIETDIDAIDVNDDRIYGLFPEFMPSLNDAALNAAIHSLSEVKDSDITDVLASIPAQWGITGATRSKWADVIIKRRDRVCETIRNGLINQTALEL